jgi:hypothetical protein
MPQANCCSRWLDPAGGLIHASRGNVSQLAADGTASFPFYAGAGQFISVVARPASPDAILQISMTGSAAHAVSPAPGAPAILPLTWAPAAGSRIIEVTSDVDADVALDVFLNTALEAESGDSGPGRPVDLGPAFLELTAGGSGRYAVVGSSEPRTLEQGSAVWAVQPQAGRIVRLSTATGQILDSFAAPDALQPGHTHCGPEHGRGRRDAALRERGHRRRGAVPARS